MSTSEESVERSVETIRGNRKILTNIEEAANELSEIAEKLSSTVDEFKI